MDGNLNLGSLLWFCSTLPPFTSLREAWVMFHTSCLILHMSTLGFAINRKRKQYFRIVLNSYAVRVILDHETTGSPSDSGEAMPNLHFDPKRHKQRLVTSFFSVEGDVSVLGVPPSPLGGTPLGQVTMHAV